jgi:hypothetical protein
MQKSVKRDMILDFFHGKCLDLCGGQKTKINTPNSRGDWLRNIHLDQSTRHPEPAGEIYGGKNGWPCRPDQKSLRWTMRWSVIDQTDVDKKNYDKLFFSGPIEAHGPSRCWADQPITAVLNQVL